MLTRRITLALLTALALLVGTFVGAPMASSSTSDPDVIAGAWIVTVKDGYSSARVSNEHGQRHGAQVSHIYRHALNGYAAKMSDTAAARVGRDSRVRAVVADRVVRALAQETPTGVDRVDGDVVLQPSSTTTKLINNSDERVDADVAIIDTGIDVDHPDLHVVDGKNCQNGPSYDDGNGHGTHVAGTVAALDNTIGVVGVAPGARLHAVRVLNNAGSGSWSTVICGVDWVTGFNDTTNGYGKIEVANMSLGGSGSDGSCTDGGLREAICASVAAGVTYAVAAGNSEADAAGHVPATYEEVITVSALADSDGVWNKDMPWSATCRTDEEDSFANFSNYGADVDLTAPGVCILSTWKDGGYNTISGTSMAAPHVAGAAALYKSSNPLKSPSEVKTALQSAGNLDWNNVDDPDYPDGKETHLNVSAFTPALVNEDSGSTGDTSAPTNVLVTSPTGGASFVEGSAVSLAATADDNVGVSTVKFYVDGVLEATDTVDDGWTGSWTAEGVGTRLITAEAYDAAGNATTSSAVSISVTSSSTSSGLTLTASSSKAGPNTKVALSWSGATGSSVDIYRDGALLATTSNDGSHEDNLKRATGDFTYWVCEASANTCSNQVIVSAT